MPAPRRARPAAAGAATAARPGGQHPRPGGEQPEDEQHGGEREEHRDRRGPAARRRVQQPDLRAGPRSRAGTPTACANADSEAAVAASGARAAVKKIASARAAFWPAPRISAQATAPPSGAYSSPARPPAIAATVGTTSSVLRAHPLRDHRDDQRDGQVADAHQGEQVARRRRRLAPRSRSIVGSQDSVGVVQQRLHAHEERHVPGERVPVHRHPGAERPAGGRARRQRRPPARHGSRGRRPSAAATAAPPSAAGAASQPRVSATEPPLPCQSGTLTSDATIAPRTAR